MFRMLPKWSWSQAMRVASDLLVEWDEPYHRWQAAHGATSPGKERCI